MEKAFLNCLAAWLIPGAGYVLLQRWWEAVLLFTGTMLLIVLGFRLGGLYYPGSAADFGIMYWLHQLSGSGNAVFVLLNLFFRQSLNSREAVAAFGSATFEYGGRCLALAGLINFLAILHVYDSSTRRALTK